MPRAKSPRGHHAAPTARQQSPDADPFQLDFGDCIVGIAWMIAIPVAAYLALGACGMPVGGKQQTWEQAFEAQEHQEAITAQVVVQEDEYRYFMGYCTKLLDEYAPNYMRFAEKQDDPTIQIKLLDAARNCAASSESHLKRLREAVEKQSLGNEKLHEIDRKLASATRLRQRIKELDQFKGLRGG